jgi:hypothetical protein
MLGAALIAAGTFGVSYLGASEVEAQSSTTYCEWDGNDCKSPQKTNYCICEDPAGN